MDESEGYEDAVRNRPAFDRKSPNVARVKPRKSRPVSNGSLFRALSSLRPPTLTRAPSTVLLPRPMDQILQSSTEQAVSMVARPL